jgi:hypothetical protein
METFEPVLDSLGNPRLVIVRDDPKTGLGRFRKMRLATGICGCARAAASDTSL